MKTEVVHILAFAHDPGGVNALIPVIKALDTSKYAIDVYGKHSSKKQFEAYGISCMYLPDVCSSVESLEVFLANNNFDVALTGTSANDYTEKYLWQASRNIGIISVAIVDAWLNYGIRFSKWTQVDIDKYNEMKDVSFLPSAVCVMDELSQNEMVREGIPKHNIRVTGQPYLESIKKGILGVSKDMIDSFRHRYLGGSLGKRIILYASDNISSSFNDTEGAEYLGYNEKTIFEELNKVLERRCQDEFILVIRPHPKEGVEYWNERIKSITSYSVIIDKDTPVAITLNSVDIVISMISMILIEASLINKPIMSVQIGLKNKDLFYLSQIGVEKPILSNNELSKAIDEFFCNRFVNHKWDSRTFDDATRRIINVLEDEIWLN